MIKSKQSKYITETTDEAADATKSEKIKQIHKRVRQVRMSEKMGVKYMQRWEEVVYARQDGIAEGKELGIAEGKELGITEGKLLGMNEGEEKLLIKLVCRKLMKGKSIQNIADELEEDIDKVSWICEVADRYAPEYDCDKIYKAMYAET